MYIYIYVYTDYFDVWKYKIYAYTICFVCWIPSQWGEMNGAATRFLSYRSLARPSSLDCARMDGFILICLTTNRWCAARAMSEYIPHIYIYILHKEIMNFLCQSGMFFARFHLKPGTAHWQMNNGVMAPAVHDVFWNGCLKGFRASHPIVPYRKVQMQEILQSELVPWSFLFFSASNAGLWHCKTNPMLHLVKTKPKKGNNNLDRTNLHEKWQFFWAMKQISTFRWEVAAEIKFLRRIWRPFFDMSRFLLHLGS